MQFKLNTQKKKKKKEVSDYMNNCAILVCTKREFAYCKSIFYKTVSEINMLPSAKNVAKAPVVPGLF